MDLGKIRKGRDGCPSALRLERYVAGELGAADRATIEAHEKTCPHCSADIASAREGFAAWPELDAAKSFDDVVARAQKSKSARRWRAALIAAGPLAVAALLVLVLRPPTDEGHSPAPSPASVGVRTKGQTVLRVFRQTPSGSEELTSGADVYAGQKLRFVVDLPSDGSIAIVGVEASARLYTAWPLAGAGSPLLDAGSSQELPGAIALDASRGRETLYLVHCPGASESPRCRENPAGPPLCGAGCSLSPFVLEKR